MSEKFDMKLVIDAVTTPLLHARLSAAGSYRERAALLRSLAESALRGHPLAGSSSGVAATEVAVQLAIPQTEVQSAPVRQPSAVPRVLHTWTSGEVSEAVTSEGHDVDQIADAFGTFF